MDLISRIVRLAHNGGIKRSIATNIEWLGRILGNKLVDISPDTVKLSFDIAEESLIGSIT